jgi:hypothetical protein
MQSTPKMNQMQLHLLQFFAQKEVSNQEAEDIKRMIAQYYFDKAEAELNHVLKVKNITQADIDNLSNQHLRTPYRKQ